MQSLRVIFGLMLFSVLASVDAREILSDDFQTDDATTYSGLQKVSIMPLALSDMTATYISEDVFDDSNGPRVYVIGGCIGTQQCSYDSTVDYYSCSCTDSTNLCHYFLPETNLWYYCTSAPSARYRHTAAYANGLIWVTGGRTIPEDAIMNSIDYFNPITNVWGTLDSKYEWSGFTSDGGVTAIGTSIYYLGGYDQVYNSVGTLSRFDTVTYEWDHTLPSMSHPRGDVTVHNINNDEFYALGGWESSDGFCQPLTYVEKFSLSENTWSDVPNMIYGRGKPAVGHIGSYLFAIAGETRYRDHCYNGLSVPVPVVSRFTEDKNSWEVEANISTSLYRFVAVSYNGSSVKDSGTIYLFGGQTSYESATLSYPLSNEVLKYTPVYYTSSSKEVLSGGATAGVVIAGIVFLLAVAAVSYFAYYYYTKKNAGKGEFSVVASDTTVTNPGIQTI